MIELFAIIPLYIACVYINAGFLYADTYCGISSSERDLRVYAAYAIGISIIPVLPWLLTPFVTGFYYSGWMRPGSIRAQSQ